MTAETLNDVRSPASGRGAASAPILKTELLTVRFGGLAALSNVNFEVKRDEVRAILEDVWGLPQDLDTRAIDNFVVRLRRYIEDRPGAPKFLQTVRGVGYRFVPDA